MSDRELTARALYRHDERVEGDGRPVPWDQLTSEWSKRYLAKADAVLAALSAAGRLRAEVTCCEGEVVDVLKIAEDAATAEYDRRKDAGFEPRTSHGLIWLAVRQAAPIIAADAERRVREREDLMRDLIRAGCAVCCGRSGGDWDVLMEVIGRARNIINPPREDKPHVG